MGARGGGGLGWARRAKAAEEQVRRRASATGTRGRGGEENRGAGRRGEWMRGGDASAAGPRGQWEDLCFRRDAGSAGGRRDFAGASFVRGAWDISG